jgi:hypothetical protein
MQFWNSFTEVGGDQSPGIRCQVKKISASSGKTGGGLLIPFSVSFINDFISIR